MVKRAVIAVLGFYQRFIRLAFPLSCRFVPSCSEYAKQAILKYGFLKGGLKAVLRILRCHPLSGSSGYDPLL